MKKVLLTVFLAVIAVMIAAPRAHAAIALYGTATSSVWTTGASETVGIPNGGTTVSSPTLVIIEAVDRGGVPGFAVPSGYTLLAESDIDSVDQEQIFYKNYASGSTLPTSLTVNLNDTGASFAGLLVVDYQGYNASSPFDGSAITFASTTASNTLTAPSITTTQANDNVVWTFAIGQDIGVDVDPSVSQGTTEGEITRAQSIAAFYANISDRLASLGAAGINTLTVENSTTLNAAITFAIAPALQGPVISNATASGVTTTGATITWSTDLSATSQVNYGTSLPYTSIASSSATSTSHSITLSGLSPGTTYHFQAQSTANSITTTSTDAMFTTSALPPPPPAPAAPTVSVGVGGGYALYSSITLTGNVSSSNPYIVSVNSNAQFPVPSSQLKMVFSHYANLSDGQTMPYAVSMPYNVCPTTTTTSTICAPGTYEVFVKFYEPSSTLASTASAVISIGANQTFSPEIATDISNSLTALSSVIASLLSQHTAISPAILNELSGIEKSLQGILSML